MAASRGKKAGTYGVIFCNNWTDKHLWGDAGQMEAQYMADTCQTYFDGLLAIINDEYARFFDIIIGELNDIPAKLVFDRSRENTSRSTDEDFSLTRLSKL
jgi:hypothetical protein